MVWAVSLSTTKLSPRRLTRLAPVVAFAVWLGLVTSTWPRAHPALYLHDVLPGGCTCMHFGENQLSPRSVGISPLSTAPPPVLQHWWVRASTPCHRRFTLAMDSSRGFGSNHRHRRPVQTRFPSGSPTLAWVNPATTMYSPDHSTKGTPSGGGATTGPHVPLTAGKYAVSGTLSSPSRGAFHLSLTVLVPYRSLKVFSLGGWSPLLPTNSPGFVVLRKSAGLHTACPYRTLTCCGGVFQRLRVGHGTPWCCSYNPSRSCEPLVWAAPASLATTTGISLDFSSSGY